MYKCEKYFIPADAKGNILRLAMISETSNLFLCDTVTIQCRYFPHVISSVAG